jgi:hypothetical protein
LKLAQLAVMKSNAEIERSFAPQIGKITTLWWVEVGLTLK